MKTISLKAEELQKEFLKIWEEENSKIVFKENIVVMVEDINIIYKTNKAEIAVRVEQFKLGGDKRRYEDFLGMYSIILDFSLHFSVDICEIKQKIERTINLINILSETVSGYGRETDNVIYI